MKIIVGIGNIGKQYERTRHNLGFMVIDYFAKKYDFTLNKKAFKGEYAVVNFESEKVIFAKPHTYVNNSGDFVSQIVDFYKIDKKDILIIIDDKDLEFLKIRRKSNSSSGGHNGMKDIISKLKTKEISRIKIGIGKPSKENSTCSYVLSKFNDSELQMISEKMPEIEKEIIKFILNEERN